MSGQLPNIEGFVACTEAPDVVERMSRSERIAVIRARMRAAAENAGLTLLQIGKGMGYEDEKAATNVVWYLLNRSKRPSYDRINQFCSAVGIRIEDLFRGL